MAPCTRARPGLAVGLRFALCVAIAAAPGASRGEAPTSSDPNHGLDDSAPLAAASLERGGALSRAALIQEILRRNPTLDAARAALAAARQRPAQREALDDPIVGYGVAPRSFGTRGIDDAHVLDVSQALPFPGKRGLRGDAARAEAGAARADWRATRQQLARDASLLFDEYYLASRGVAIHRAHVELLERFVRVALARYEAGEAAQQDPLQAEVELAMLLQLEIAARAQQRVARQRLNTLLFRDPAAPLAPPPAILAPPALPESLEPSPLIAVALAARPELDRVDARIRAREAELALAEREFLPDFTLVGNYNRRLPISENRPFVGVRVNVPLQIGRRRAARSEAEALLARARSERQRQVDAIELEVHASLTRLHEARESAALFEARLLPAARSRVAAARAGFETGRNSFLVLIDAERALRQVELDHARALANVSQGAARVLVAIGRAPGTDGETP